MSCLFPVVIYPSSDKKHSRFYHNKRGNKLLVRCNHCVSCIDERIRIWTYRLMAESRLYEKMSFITLTYDDDNLPEKRGTTCKEDVQKLMKRLRRYYDYHYDKHDMSYFGCTEYGGVKGRIHAHLLVFGLDYNDFLPKNKKVVTHNTINCDSPFWKFGLLNYGTDVSLQDSRLVKYVTKYIEKLDTDNLYKFCRIMDIEIPKTLKSVGLGAEYFRSNLNENGELPKINGLKVSLPIYWQKKFDIATNHDDWICGQINKEVQDKKRAKLMEGTVNSNENYARLIERNKRGIL